MNMSRDCPDPAKSNIFEERRLCLYPSGMLWIHVKMTFQMEKNYIMCISKIGIAGLIAKLHKKSKNDTILNQNEIIFTFLFPTHHQFRFADYITQPIVELLLVATHEIHLYEIFKDHSIRYLQYICRMVTLFQSSVFNVTICWSRQYGHFLFYAWLDFFILLELGEAKVCAIRERLVIFLNFIRIE